MIQSRFLLIPFSKRLIKEDKDFGFIGYAD